METKNMLYLVTEYAKNGEIFGEWPQHLKKAFLFTFFMCSPNYFRKRIVLLRHWRFLETSIKLFCWVYLACPCLYLKGHMIARYQRTVSWYGPPHILLLTAIINVLMCCFFSHLTWHHRWAGKTTQRRPHRVKELIYWQMHLVLCLKYKPHWFSNVF